MRWVSSWTQRTGLLAHGTIAKKNKCFDDTTNPWDRRPPSDRECHKSENFISKSNASWRETELDHQSDTCCTLPQLWLSTTCRCYCSSHSRVHNPHITLDWFPIIVASCSVESHVLFLLHCCCCCCFGGLDKCGFPIIVETRLEKPVSSRWDPPCCCGIEPSRLNTTTGSGMLAVFMVCSSSSSLSYQSS